MIFRTASLTSCFIKSIYATESKSGLLSDEPTPDSYYEERMKGKEPIEITGCAKMYSVNENGVECILKYFTDERRRKRETKICKSIANNSNITCAPSFYHIGKHIITRKIDGDELGNWLKKNEKLILSKNDSDKLQWEPQFKKILTGYFKAVLQLHLEKIVHANLHNRNIMVDKNNDVFLIDYCESWEGKSEAFFFDYLKMKNHVLDPLENKYGISWTNFIDYNVIGYERPALEIMINKFYSSGSLVFAKWLCPNACRLNYQIANFVSKILGLFCLDKTQKINKEYCDELERIRKSR